MTENHSTNSNKIQYLILLQPWTETAIQIPIINDNVEEGLCPYLQILEGVYFCQSIIKANNCKAITILNTIERTVEIHNIEN